MLLEVQRNGDSGSPRVTGSMRLSRSVQRVLSVSVVRLRPPPGLRMRPETSSGSGFFPASRSSLQPAVMVGRETPVAWETKVVPPYQQHNTTAQDVNVILRQILSTQCLDRRIPDGETLKQEIDAWQTKRNQHKTKLNWQFGTDLARVTNSSDCIPRWNDLE